MVQNELRKVNDLGEIFNNHIDRGRRGKMDTLTKVLEVELFGCLHCRADEISDEKHVEK